jgi:hypothetical protein
MFVLFGIPGCTTFSADKLQKLQNRAARILTFSIAMTLILIFSLKRLGWRKLDSQRKIEKNCYGLQLQSLMG